jgi:type IV pilus assembly protein PilP
MLRLASILLVGFCISLTGCSQGGFSDLDQYMADMRARPVGQIDPIPPIKAAQSEEYDVQTARAPFERPLPAEVAIGEEQLITLTPRAKQYLENFSLDSLSMVGTLERDGILWGLVTDPDGAVHRVRPGDYVGTNNGEILDIKPTLIQIREATPSGVDNKYVPRARQLSLRERN